MKDWLTLSEAAMELRITRKAVLDLLKQGALQGIELKESGWRILPPAQKLKRHLEEALARLEHVPLLSSAEVAVLLGISHSNVRQNVSDGRLRPRTRGGRGRPSLFTVDEVRRFTLYRERMHARLRRGQSSARLVKWAQSILAQDSSVEVQVLDGILREIAAYVPESEQPATLAALWKQFDGLAEVIRRVRACRSR